MPDFSQPESRLDRIERTLETVVFDLVAIQAAHSHFEEEHKKFLERMDEAEKRMDLMDKRMEAAHEEFAREHKLLLTAQVVFQDRLEKSRKEHDERMQEIDERLNTLIKVVDGIIRKNPPPPLQ